MVTKTASDEYVFKVPTLRNIALTAPYFHTGKAWDLRQAVAVMGTSQLGAHLSADEIDRITSFLDSLTGDLPVVVVIQRSHLSGINAPPRAMSPRAGLTARGERIRTDSQSAQTALVN